MSEHRTPQEIERDIDETRAELDATLDALQDRLNPQAAMDQAIAYARENGGLFGRNLMTQVRDNPLPAVLAGIGLTWLMTARDSGPSASRLGSGFHTVRDGLAGSSSHAGEGAEALRDRATATGHRMTQSAHDTRDRVHGARNAAAERAGLARARMEDAASSASARAGDMAHRAGDSLRSAGGYARDNPMMLGMAAAAFGLLAAAMMPRTRTEEEALEPVRDRVRGAADEAGHRARDTVSRAAHRAVDEVERHVHKAEEKVEARTNGQGNGRASPPSGDTGPRPSGTGLTDEERAARARTVAGNASRPGPLPEDEGRPGRETGAGETGWVTPPDSGGRANPRPGLSGSQQGLERP